MRPRSTWLPSLLTALALGPAGCDGRAVADDGAVPSPPASDNGGLNEPTADDGGPDGPVAPVGPDADASHNGPDADTPHIVPDADASNDGPAPSGWSCTTKPDGRYFCQKLGDPGLPTGGSNWLCHKVVKNGVPTWVCYGESTSMPGGAGWSCTQVGATTYRCEKPDSADDKPPGFDTWVCVKGTPYGGTLCEKVAVAAMPQLTAPCTPGQRFWCDDPVYSGWGQVLCDASGSWKTKVVNGKKMFDCQFTTAKVPLTRCACHHFFFNPMCCERTDCILPDGTAGQTCPKSAGKLCDYCNPLAQDCVEPGGLCIVTNSSETFCGKDCATQPCPTGYTCMTVKTKTGTTQQCVPADMSCYY
jgi:hypothetical protein